MSETQSASSPRSAPSARISRSNSRSGLMERKARQSVMKRRTSSAHLLQFHGGNHAVSELEVFLQAAHNISADMNPDAVASAIIEECCKILKCDRASLFMVDDDYLTLVIAKGANNIQLPKTAGIAGYVATNEEAVNIIDAHLDERFDSSFDLKSGYRTKSVVAVPVFDAEGDMVAVIQAINKEGDRPFSKKDLMLLENFSKHASVALNNAYIYERTLEAERKLSSLVDMVLTLHSQPHTSSLIFTISHRSHQLVGADRCTLYLVDQARENLVVMQGDIDIRFPISKGLAGYVATEGKVVNIPDCYEDERFNRSIDIKTGYHTKAMLCMPILGADRTTPVGVLQLINKLDGSEFMNEDEHLLSVLLSIAGPMLETSSLRSQLKQHTRDYSDKQVEMSDHKSRAKKPAFQPMGGLGGLSEMAEGIEEEDEDC